VGNACKILKSVGVIFDKIWVCECTPICFGRNYFNITLKTQLQKINPAQKKPGFLKQMATAAETIMVNVDEILE